jgi:hypothetical protein
MDYKEPFMNFVMNPPRQEKAKYTMYEPQVSTMRIISDGSRGSGLGQLPEMSSGGDQQSWVMPVVIIVVSAMALMTVYALLSKR